MCIILTGRRPQLRMLPRNKEEVFILSNGPSQRESVLITLEAVVGWRKIIPSVEDIVPQEIIGGPVEFIGSTAGNGVHDTAPAASKLGVVAIGLKAELSDGVRIWKDIRYLSVRIFVKTAIQIERGRVASAAAGRDHDIAALWARSELPVYGSRIGRYI